MYLILSFAFILYLACRFGICGSFVFETKNDTELIMGVQWVFYLFYIVQLYKRAPSGGRGSLVKSTFGIRPLTVNIID